MDPREVAAVVVATAAAAAAAEVATAAAAPESQLPWFFFADTGPAASRSPGGC